MREIKFRGKVVENDPFIAPADRWVQGFYYQNLEGGEIKHYIKGDTIAWEVLPETVGQFTGMKDKDGKEIYEGDVVLVIPDCFDSRKTGEVIFEDGRFKIKIKDGSWVYYKALDKSEKYNDGKCSCTINYEFEVIGNHHDNPETLK